MMQKSEAGNWIELVCRRLKRGPAITRFTFIELCIVLVIIAVSVTLVWPGVTGWMGGRGINSAARRLAIMGEHVSDLAATTGKMHLLTVDISEGYLHATLAGEHSGSGGPKEAGAVGDIYRLPEGVRFSKVRLHGDVSYDGRVNVRFTQDGWADDAAFYLEDEKGSRITVAFTRSMGRVVVEEGHQELL